MTGAIVLASFIVGIALYMGLSEIAQAIRNRTEDVHLKLDKKLLNALRWNDRGDGL